MWWQRLISSRIDLLERQLKDETARSQWFEGLYIETRDEAKRATARYRKREESLIDRLLTASAHKVNSIPLPSTVDTSLATSVAESADAVNERLLDAVERETIRSRAEEYVSQRYGESALDNEAMIEKIEKQMMQDISYWTAN